MTPDNLLGLTRCMRCGYSLRALPAEGICPECGTTYDQETVVLYGLSQGGYGSATAGSRGFFVTSLIGSTMVAFSGIDRWIHKRDVGGLVIAGAIAVWIVLQLVWRWLVARNAPNGCLLQCRFNSAGFVQCDLPDDMAGTMGFGKLIRWANVGFVVVIVILWLSPFDSKWTPLKLGACIVLGAVAYWMHRVRRPARPTDNRLCRDLTKGASGGILRSSPVAWSEVDGFAVHPIQGRPNRHLLRITWKKQAFIDLVETELDCTTKQAKELCKRIARWISPPEALPVT